MTLRDREALNDIIAVIDHALGFPIHDFDALEQTDYLQDALIRCLEVLGEAGLPARSPAKRSWWP